MPNPIRVLIVDDTPKTVANLRRLLGFEDDIEVVGSATTAAAGLDEARKLEPNVLLMDVNLPDLDGIRATELVTQQLPLVSVVLVSVQEDKEYRRRALQAGAREYLLKPFTADELVGTIRQVHEQDERKQAGGPSTQPKPRKPAAEGGQASVAVEAAPADGFDMMATAQLPAIRLPTPPPPVMLAPETTAPLLQEIRAMRPAPAAPAPPPAAPIVEPALADEKPPELALPVRRSETGVVTVIFSGKGGVGKSIIAVNLAAALIQETGGAVALVDLDLQFGDLSVLLGLDPAGTIADVARAYPRVDATFLGELMPEAPGGIRVLAAPLSPEIADMVSAEHVRHTLTVLKDTFDHVVVDCSPHLDDVALEAIECADKLILVTDLNIPAIKDAKLVFKLFEHLNVSRESVHLVLNRADAPADVTVTQLEANLKCPVSVRIPSQGKLVLQSIQKGVPFVQLFPEAEISLKMRELVGCLVPLAGAKGPSAQKSAKKRFWARPNAS